MKLVKFRVTDFRSVADSGWIEVDGVTALIGTNESGKTNLLLPLWKLNPAREGEIEETADFPRKHYTTMRAMKPKPTFIEAVFEDAALASELATLTGLAADNLREIHVSADFDGNRTVRFPKGKPPRSLPRSRIEALIKDTERDITGFEALKAEQELKARVLETIAGLLRSVGETDVTGQALATMIAAIESLPLADAPKTGVIAPRAMRLQESLRAARDEVTRPEPHEAKGVSALVLKRLPKFVYYSNYGNLDSDIYLPQVIEDMERNDLGTKAAAKARTLRVLFKFVKLEPDEILELGRDFKDPQKPTREPTDEELQEISEKKKQRSILLQSASALLTERFRAWWKQGDYRFRFEADGNHFRIWVSDDRRPEEVELENRSTGLQWFLSFYLVFLVESEEAHADAILLLDEPGLSLHPLAQKDLSTFFDGLSKTNQLLYTTHSPFLVDADRLERARKVYVSADGTTKATADLRGGDGGPSQRGAGYAVLAALGLSVADTMLIGCAPVVVEGPSDQHYLGAIKNLLIAAGKLRPGREMVFPPAGGAKTVKAVASILSARDEDLPVALFDSDSNGKKLAKDLRASLYSDAGDRVLEVGDFLGMEGAEVEDLLPVDLLVQQIDRWQRGPDVPFADVHKPGSPIIPQIEAWAAGHGVSLTLGWKVELAKRVKQAMLQKGPDGVNAAVMERWAKLFAVLEERAKPATPEGG